MWNKFKTNGYIKSIKNKGISSVRGWKTIVFYSISTHLFTSFTMQKCVKYYVNIKKNVVEGVMLLFQFAVSVAAE